MGTYRGDNDDPRSVDIILVLGVGVILFIVIVLGLEALYGTAQEDETERKLANRRPGVMESQRQDQKDALGAYRWLDQEAGVVSLPIERAMELIARESGGSR